MLINMNELFLYSQKECTFAYIELNNIKLQNYYRHGTYTYRAFRNCRQKY